MESYPASYVNFPVHETIDIKDASDIRIAVDRMVEAYVRLSQYGNFSYRLLLPKGEKLTKAKKLGLTIQAEFLLALKKKTLKPNVREIRYIHDKDHYGWVLANPERFST
ncbi:MAG: hypothetical protein ACJ709_03995 [Nitrososphaeraceae archaeon]